MNFHVIRECAAIWTLPGIITGKDTELHCGSQDAHFMDSGSDDLVPCGFGAKRGLDPFQHNRWALQQVHRHASMQAVLGTKARCSDKVSGFEKSSRIWMKSERTGWRERRSWLQGAPASPRPLLAGIHGLLWNEVALACGRDHGLTTALQHGLPFVGVLPTSSRFCKPGGHQR